MEMQRLLSPVIFSLSATAIIVGLVACGGGSGEVADPTINGGGATGPTVSSGPQTGLSVTATVRENIVTLESLTTASPTAVAPLADGVHLEFPIAVSVPTDAVLLFQGGAYEVASSSTTQGKTVVELRDARITSIFSELKISGTQDFSDLLDGRVPASSQAKAHTYAAGLGDTNKANVVEFGVTDFAAKIYSVGDSVMTATAVGGIGPEGISPDGIGMEMQLRHSIAWEASGAVTATLNFQRSVGAERCKAIPDIKLSGNAKVIELLVKLLHPEFCVGLEYGLYIDKPEKPVIFNQSTATNPLVLDMGGRLVLHSDGPFENTLASNNKYVSFDQQSIDIRPVDTSVFEECKPVKLEPTLFGQVAGSLKVLNNLTIIKPTISISAKTSFDLVKLPSVPGVDNVKYGSSASLFLGAQVEAGMRSDKVFGKSINTGLYKSDLIPIVTIFKVPQTPMPVCDVVNAPKVVGDVVIAPTTFTVPVGDDGKFSSPDPTVKVSPDGSVSFPGPGDYVINFETTAPNGAKETHPTTISIVPSGNYVGTWDGTDSGQFTLTIDSSGNISGTGLSNTGQSKSASGHAGTKGDIQFLTGTTAGGAQFQGSIVPRAGHWFMSGTFVNKTSGYHGTFQGSST